MCRSETEKLMSSISKAQETAVVSLSLGTEQLGYQPQAVRRPMWQLWHYLQGI